MSWGCLSYVLETYLRGMILFVLMKVLLLIGAPFVDAHMNESTASILCMHGSMHACTLYI